MIGGVDTASVLWLAALLAVAAAGACRGLVRQLTKHRARDDEETSDRIAWLRSMREPAVDQFLGKATVVIRPDVGPLLTQVELAQRAANRAGARR